MLIDPVTVTLSRHQLKAALEAVTQRGIPTGTFALKSPGGT